MASKKILIVTGKAFPDCSSNRKKELHHCDCAVSDRTSHCPRTLSTQRIWDPNLMNDIIAEEQKFKCQRQSCMKYDQDDDKESRRLLFCLNLT